MELLTRCSNFVLISIATLGLVATLSNVFTVKAEYQESIDKFHSTCEKGDTPWNSKNIGDSLKEWIRSVRPVGKVLSEANILSRNFGRLSIP